MEKIEETKLVWFEDLPDSCPEEGAVPPEDYFYRITDNKEPKCEDFWSHRKNSLIQLSKLVNAELYQYQSSKK